MGGIPPDDAISRLIESAEGSDATLGPARGGRKAKKAVLWEVLRPLRVPEDLPLLSQTLPAQRANLTQIKHSHHQLARLIAEGTDQSECSLITGYSPSYITVLKSDTTFNELISYYASQREQVFVDTIERMRTLGLNTLEELQSRLETDPTAFSNRELMEQAELMLVKPIVATRGHIGSTASGPGNAAAGGVQVNVNFVKSSSNSSGPVIDATPTGVIIDVAHKDAP